MDDFTPAYIHFRHTKKGENFSYILDCKQRKVIGKINTKINARFLCRASLYSYIIQRLNKLDGLPKEAKDVLDLWLMDTSDFIHSSEHIVCDDEESAKLIDRFERGD